MEGYEDRRKGEKSPKFKSKKKVVKEHYESQVPELQRAIDFVVEGVTKSGVGAFEKLVETAEVKFAIYNDDLKNYFAEAIAEDFSLKPKNKAALKKREVGEPIIHHIAGKKMSSYHSDEKKLMGRDATPYRRIKEEEFKTPHVKAIADYLKGPKSGKELADKYFGPRRKKTASQKKASKRFRSN